MKVWNSVQPYRSALSYFYKTYEELDEVLGSSASDLEKCISRERVNNFKQLLRSGSDKVRSEGTKIAAAAFIHREDDALAPELLASIRNVTYLLQTKPIDPEDLKFTKHHEPDVIQATLKASQDRVNQQLSGVHAAHHELLSSMTPPVNETDSKVLAAVKKLFLSTENPFCLVNSEDSSLPNLSSIQPPQIENSIDPLTITMRGAYSEWAKKAVIGKGPSEQLEAVWNKALLENLEASYVYAQQVLPGINPDDQLLKMAMSHVVRRVTDAAALIKNHANKRSNPLRVALVGCMSHGKSSFINSLIGQHLLLHEAGSSTSCPMVVEHVPKRETTTDRDRTRGPCNEGTVDSCDCDENTPCETDRPGEPVLYIDLDHFSEYTATLKQFGDLLTSTGAANERVVAYKQLWNGSFDDEQQKWLIAFLDGWRLRSKYRGKEAIIQVQKDIRDLIELSIAVSKSPKPKNLKWPKLLTYMKEMDSLTEPFQIVDLPGCNDPNTSERGNQAIIEQNHRDVLNEVDGVILVAITHNDRWQEAIKALEFGRNELPLGQAPLLMCIGTKKDQQQEGMWSEASDQNFSRAVFKTSPNRLKGKCKNSPRLIQSSPGVYLDSPHALRLFRSLPGPTPNITLQKIKQEHPIAYRELVRLYRYGSASDDAEKLARDEERFKFQTMATICMDLQTDHELCKYEAVRAHINKHVIEAGRKRGHLLELAELLPLMDQIQEAHAVALRASFDVPVAQNAMQIQRASFEPRTKAIFEDWIRSKRQGQKIQVIEIILPALSGAFQKAESHLEKLIYDGFSKHAVGGSKSKLKSVQDGMNLLLEVEKGLKKQLNSCQLEIVETIRLKAKQVWAGSFHDLQARINEAIADDEEDGAAFSLLKEELRKRVEELKVSTISSQVRQKIQAELTLKAPYRPFVYTQELAKKLTGYGMSALRSTDKMIAKLMGQRDEGNSLPLSVSYGHLDATQDAADPNKALAGWLGGKIDIYLHERRIASSPLPHLEDLRLTRVQNNSELLDTFPTAEEIAAGDSSINAVGFLIRASALASAVECPTTVKVWPWITMPPNSQVDVDPYNVKKEYKTRVLNHWMEIMTRECIDSIAGAIDLIIERGQNCVHDFVSKKESVLTEIEAFNGHSFPPETLDDLVLFRANAISTGLLARDFGQKLYEAVTQPDPRTKLGLPTFA